MKVSIIVPVYKVEKYISRCFNSIIDQSYTDIECIFVDDCTPDKSYEMLCHMVESYTGRIVFYILRHTQNKGLSAARNTGTQVSKGEYLFYLDSDDEITPHCIQDLMEIVYKHKNVDIVQGNTRTIPKPNPKRDWRNLSSKGFPKFSSNKEWIKKHFFVQPRIPVNAWNKLIKKAFIFDNNLFFAEGIIHEDEHWMFFVSQKIKSIGFVNNYTYNHYLVDGSIMRSGLTHRSIESILFIVNDMIDGLDEFNLSEQRKYIFKLIKNDMLRIDRKLNKNGILNRYKHLIIKKISNSLRSLRLIDTTILLCFLLPKSIYSRWQTQKFIESLIKLC